MGRHANLVTLRELVLEKDVLHFVFEFLPRNLHQLIKAARPAGFSDERVASMAAARSPLRRWTTSAVAVRQR